MKLLSLDPSLNNCGFAYFEGKSLKKFGTAKSKGETLPQKLTSLIGNIPSPPWDSCLTPDVVVIESAPKFVYNRSASRFGKPLNFEAMGKLCMATGALIHHFASKGVKVETVDVMRWKGQQKKETTMENALRLYGVTVNDHVADSIMLGHFWLSEQKIYSMIRR